MRTFFGILAIGCGLFLQACGPTVRLKPGIENSNIPLVIAILPAQVDAGIQRERVDYIQNSVRTQLENRGFVRLDQRLVDAACTTTSCPGLRELIEKYGLEGLMKLELNSASKANFFAGYYNSISGSLTLMTPQRDELVNVSHRESKRGGLLFNSGQIIQGIISQVENSGDEGFHRLADKFSETLVAQIPQPKNSAQEARVVDVKISSLSTKHLRNSVFEICASGTPGMQASLILPRVKSNLRELSPGTYCGNFSFDGNVSDKSRMSVELTSPFGISNSKPLESAPFIACNLNGILKCYEEGATTRLSLACKDPKSCGGQLDSCKDAKFIVYKAAQESGPFNKIAEIDAFDWTDHSGQSKPVYQVMAVKPQAGRSVPVEPQP